MNDKITYRQALQEGEKILGRAGIEDASWDAWLLLEYTSGISRASFLADRERQMDSSVYGEYLRFVGRRAEHIPLQHLTKVQEFMGYPFQVNEHVLIPRQDTEVLVEEALKIIRPGMHVLDLCTGSGCIIISVKKQCPDICADASDLSEDALLVAEKNGHDLGAVVNWMQSDLFEKFEGKEHAYDVILSNPPYIRTDVIRELSEEVRLHEPYQALDGKEDGLHFYREIIGKSGTYLKESGYLLFEIGYDQGADVKALMENAGYKEVKVIKDLAGLDRVVIGEKSYV